MVATMTIPLLTDGDGAGFNLPSSVHNKNAASKQQYAADLHDTKLAFWFAHRPAIVTAHRGPFGDALDRNYLCPPVPRLFRLPL